MQSDQTSKTVADGASAVPSTTSRVHDRLRQMIITGEIRPGQKLKVEELRVKLGAGASPIREALSLLTSAYLVNRIDQRGFRAAEVSANEFRELLTTRCWLEERALRESIAAGGAAWEEQLVVAHHRLARAKRNPTDSNVIDDNWERRHRQFHQALIAACGSSILLRFCDELYDQNIRYRHIAGRRQGYGERNIDAEHAAIAEATLDRDADEAAKRLTAHYQRTGGFLENQLD